MSFAHPTGVLMLLVCTCEQVRLCQLPTNTSLLNHQREYYSYTIVSSKWIQTPEWSLHH